MYVLIGIALGCFEVWGTCCGDMGCTGRLALLACDCVVADR